MLLLFCGMRTQMLFDQKRLRNVLNVQEYHTRTRFLRDGWVYVCYEDDMS